MGADLRTQVAIGVASCDFNRRAFNARLVTLGIIVHLGAEFVALGPTEIHTEEHLGPVLCIHPAATGVHTHNSIAFVVFAIQHQRELELLDFLLELGKRPGDLVLHCFIRFLL